MYILLCLGLTLFAVFVLLRGMYLMTMVVFGKKGEETLGKVIQDSLIAMFLFALVGYLMKSPPLALNTFLLILKLVIIMFLVIGLHEVGHFYAARVLKIPVKIFSVGVGPTMFNIKRIDIIFQLKILPVAGYVLTDVNGEENLPLIFKCFFYLAGIFVNLISFILSFGILSVQNGKGFLYGIIFAFNKIPIVFKGFYQLLLNLHFTDLISPKHDLENSIGSFISMTQFVEHFWAGFAILSLILALINIIPIPIADGGRVVIACLTSIMQLFRVPEKFIQTITYVLLMLGAVIYFAPMIINTLWANSQWVGISLVEYLLWIALVVSILMNIKIFFENKKGKPVN